jgi:hypothetical protein
VLFKDYHWYPMYLGIKTYTRRLWQRPHVKIGGTYDVTHKMMYQPEDVVGYIHVSEIYKQPLRMMTEEEAYKEGAYTVESYRKVLCEIAKEPWENLQYAIPYVVKFTFTPSDMIDPNGGDQMKKEYFMKWKLHMIKIGQNIWQHE